MVRRVTAHLGEIAISPTREESVPVALQSRSRECNDLDMRDLWGVGLANPDRRLQAVETFHLVVHQDEVEPFPFERFQRLVAVPDRLDREACLGQEASANRAVEFVVVDDEDLDILLLERVAGRGRARRRSRERLVRNLVQPDLDSHGGPDAVLGFESDATSHEFDKLREGQEIRERFCEFLRTR